MCMYMQLQILRTTVEVLFCDQLPIERIMYCISTILILNHKLFVVSSNDHNYTLYMRSSWSAKRITIKKQQSNNQWAQYTWDLHVVEFGRASCRESGFYNVHVHAATDSPNYGRGIILRPASN